MKKNVHLSMIQFKNFSLFCFKSTTEVRHQDRWRPRLRGAVIAVLLSVGSAQEQRDPVQTELRGMATAVASTSGNLDPDAIDQ